MIWKHVGKMGLLLSAFAIVTTAALAMTYLQTKKIVDRNEALALLDRINAVMPRQSYNNNLLNDTVQVTAPAQLGSDDPVAVYRARKNGKPTGIVFQAIAPNGYSGKIVLLVGIYANGQIAGVRVLSHKETPGLGDLIDPDKSPWIFSFTGKSLGNPPPDKWAVRKDGGVFDQFTGATITPRAVVGAVKRALEFFHTHEKILFSTPAGQRLHL